MAKIQPASSRITITDGPAGLRIVIPAKRNWFLILFMGFWLCGWAVGEVMVPTQFLKGEIPAVARFFSLAWLGAWSVGGAFAIYAWLWNLIGKEIVTVHGYTFKTRRDIGGYGFDREYDLAQIRDLRVGGAGFNMWDFSSGLQFWGIGGGLIAFDYGAKTYRFGAGLEEAEAKQAVTAIKERYRIQDGTTT